MMDWPKAYKILNRQFRSNGDFALIPIRYQDRMPIMKWRNEQIYHLRQSELLTADTQNRYFENIVYPLFESELPNQLLFSFLRENECVGYGGLVHINWIDKNAEISFIMNTALEKKDFATLWANFLNLIEQIAFGDLQLHKIYTYAFDLRDHLYPVLEQNGYIQDAILKEHCLFEGNFIDVVIHYKINYNVFLRKANVSDLDATFNWVNDPIVRQFSFNKSDVPYESHKNWFENKLDDPNCLYFILENIVGEKLGSLRIDKLNTKRAFISYLIDKRNNGRGLGKKILELGEAYIKNHTIDIDYLVGYVLPENIASIRIFEKLGYKKYYESDSIKFEKRI